MAIPLVVEVKDKPRPKFKWHPYKSVETKPLGAFSSVPYRVLHKEDIRAYIHENIEELGSSQIMNLYSHHIIGEDFIVKPKFQTLEEKKLMQFVKFPIFGENEWVRYILSRVHAKFMWLNVTFKITKEAICVVMGLNSEFHW